MVKEKLVLLHLGLVQMLLNGHSLDAGSGTRYAACFASDLESTLKQTGFGSPMNGIGSASRNYGSASE